MNLCTAWNISVFRSYENDLFPCNNKSILMSILPRQSGYNLRNENNTFHPPFSRTISFYNSFIPFTIRLWNSFPLIITESPSLNIFKNSLTHFYKTLDTKSSNKMQHHRYKIRIQTEYKCACFLCFFPMISKLRWYFHWYFDICICIIIHYQLVAHINNNNKFLNIYYYNVLSRPAQTYKTRKCNKQYKIPSCYYKQQKVMFVQEKERLVWFVFDFKTTKLRNLYGFVWK
jgi:hypothetical protein